MRMIVLAVSLFGFVSGCWLAVMEMVLHHPGYVGRLGVAVCISMISLAVVLARMFHLGARNERWLWAGAVVLIGIGVQAFARNARAAHFEGFVFIISAAIVLQGVLMLVFLGRSGHNAS
jgi:hypothetical protein